MNLERHYRIGLASEGIASGDVQYDVQMFIGAGFRPLSVVHVRYVSDLEGNHIFRWIRRTRSDGDTWQGLDVPLHEERELYKVVAKSLNGKEISSHFVSKSEFRYSVAQRAADGVVGSYKVEVSQCSAVYGVGPSRSCFVV